VLVVKLGGSLWRSGHLRDWLRQLAALGAGKAVVVPGGGPFAETVREVQGQTGFGDAVAHRMALLGMCQYGLMLCGSEPGLTAAPSVKAVRDLLAQCKVPVWLPLDLCDDPQELPQDWSLTSDSIAADLAIQLKASDLCLIKSVVPPSGAMSVQPLVKHGIVDPRLPDFLAKTRCNVWWLGPDDAGLFQKLLAGETGELTRILP
jgi:aspartokinase-like uncharacterized kinase